MLPVARLYFARPLAVKPAPCETGFFSPRPTDKDTDFLLAMTYTQWMSAKLMMTASDNEPADTLRSVMLALPADRLLTQQL